MVGSRLGLRRFFVLFPWILISDMLTSWHDGAFVSSMWASRHECTIYGDILPWKQLRYQVPLLAESCDLNCVRRRSEKRLRKTIRTLRKSINREQFHLHFAGSDYELGKSLGQPAELPGHCVAGQVLMGRKCGESGFCIKFLFNTKTC